MFTTKLLAAAAAVVVEVRGDCTPRQVHLSLSLPADEALWVSWLTVDNYCQREMISGSIQTSKI